jgi:hypothetical protein
MPIYCSSPKCRNECGKQELDKKSWEDMWKNPEAVQGTIIAYADLCDEEGNKRDIPTTDWEKIGS